MRNLKHSLLYNRSVVILYSGGCKFSIIKGDNTKMRKFFKWLAVVLGVLLVVFFIYTWWNWESISIFMGTEAVAGKTQAIPAARAQSLPPVEKAAADWPTWLGASGDSRSEVREIKTDWVNGLEKLWEIDYLCQGSAAASWAAPVVQGNRLVVTGRNADADLVFCLNAMDGSLLWQQSYPADAGASHGAGPRATPAIDGEKVYTFGRNGDLKCWRLFDGAEIWSVNVNDLGGAVPRWGHSSSPLIYGDLVIVQGGGAARTIAFDKNNGSVVWKSGHGIAGYAALQIANLENAAAILAFHGKGLAALDAESGAELWNFDWQTPYDVNATTPIVEGNRIFITSGYKTGGVLLEASRSGVKKLWQNTAISAQHSDPFIIGGDLYGYSGDSSQNRGDFVCVDLATGVEKWRTDAIGWGTCILAAGKLVCQDIRGNLYLVQPNPERFDKIGEFPRALGKVRGPVWTRPVIANGRIYLRFKQKLVCYDL